MRSPRSIGLAFALTWLVVAAGLFSAIAGAQAVAAGPGGWAICAPSGKADPSGQTDAAHRSPTCCTTLCGFALLTPQPLAGALGVTLETHSARTFTAHADILAPPAGIGVRTARAPPADL